MSDRSPLIIGYSGWEGDVFTDALKRRLARPLGSNVYWFCYRRSDVDSVPEIFRRNPNVFFVVPKKKPLLEGNIEPTSARDITEVERASVEESKRMGFAPTKDDGPFLPADTVFEGLIRAFDLAAPELTRDPLGFFADQLDNSLPKDPASEREVDFYNIQNIIERVRQAKRREDEYIAGAVIKPSESQLEQIRDGLRRADYRDALKLGLAIDINDLSSKELDELANSMWSVALGLIDNSQEEISAYDLVVLIRDQLTKQGAGETPAAKKQVATALLYKGIALGTLKRSEEAIAVYDELLQRFGAEPALQRHVVNALINKGITLGDLNRSEEEIAVYDDLLQRFGAATEPGLQEHVANAVVNKGITLGNLNRSEEAIAVYDDVLQRFGAATESALQEQVAKALVNKGYRLSTLNRSEEAIEVYDDLLQRFGPATEPTLQEQVANALINKGITLGDLNRSEEEIAVYDDLLQRFAAATEPALQERVANALINKGITLGALNRIEEELAVYDDLLQRFGPATEPALQVQVARALVNKGYRLGTLNRSEEAIAVYDDLLQRFGPATELLLQERVAKALVNKGYRLGTLNRSEEAIAVYDYLLQRFGPVTEPALQVQVARALVNKGYRLGTLNRSEEAIAVYDYLLQRFGAATEPALQKQVGHALNGIGFGLLISAKTLLLSGDKEAALDTLQRASDAISGALERLPNEPLILGNRAYIYFLMGRKNEAQQQMAQAIALGGESIRSAELADADINRLPEDDEFCEMVRSIPAPNSVP